MAEFFYSKHFTKFRSPGAVWQKAVVGLKAIGLRELPNPWTPPFVVIPTSIISKCLSNPHRIENILKPTLFKDIVSTGAIEFIVRSSAEAETMDARGKFESRKAGPAASAIAKACAQLLRRQLRILGSREAKRVGLALVIQEWRRVFQSMTSKAG
jgi:hypothetical protein